MDIYSSLFVFFVFFGQYFSFTEQACNSNHNEHGGSCYHFSLEASDFETSKESCASLGMHLVFIGSQDEQEFVVDTRPDNENEYWIGLSTVTSLAHAPTSTWLDGSSLTYINFADSGSTFDEDGECFRMSGLELQWLDKDCDFTGFHYICETENEGTSTTPNPLPVSTTQSVPEPVPDPSPVPTTQSVPMIVTLSSRDQALMRSAILKLSADNARLLDAYVHASFRVSSSVRCAQHCLADVTCSCFTYIAEEKACLLGEECQAASGVRYDTHLGSKTYSTA